MKQRRLLQLLSRHEGRGQAESSRVSRSAPMEETIVQITDHFEPLSCPKEKP